MTAPTLPFLFNRAVPFVGLGLYDAALLKLAPHWGFAIFWIALLVVPLALLLGGGFYMRRVTPVSKFSGGMVAFSLGLAIVNPFLFACTSLSLEGGVCT